MILGRFIFPALLAATAPFSICDAYQHPHRFHSHQISHRVDPTAEENDHGKQAGHRSQTTCPAVLLGPFQDVQSMLERREGAKESMGDSVLDTEQEELTRMMADLNNATSGAINYMMQLVLSIQSLSLRLSMLEATSGTPMSTPTSMATSDAYTMGPVLLNTTTRPASDRWNLTNNTARSSISSQSQTVQVIPVSTKSSASLSSSTRFIVTSSSPAGTKYAESTGSSSSNTWTSTRIITVTVEPSSLPQDITTSSRSSSTYGPAPESSRTYFEPATKRHNGSSMDGGEISSQPTLTSTVRVTVTVSTTCTRHPVLPITDRFTMPPISHLNLSFIDENAATLKPLDNGSKGPGSGASTAKIFYPITQSATSRSSSPDPHSIPLSFLTTLELSLTSPVTLIPASGSFMSSTSVIEPPYEMNMSSHEHTGIPPQVIPKRSYGSLHHSLTYVTTVRTSTTHHTLPSTRARMLY